MKYGMMIFKSITEYNRLKESAIIKYILFFIMANPTADTTKFQSMEVKGEEELWAFTWAPSDKYQYYGRKDRLKQFEIASRHLLYRSLTELKIKYDIIAEVSTPYILQDGAVGRLHLHGILCMTPIQRVKLYMGPIKLLTANARVEIKPITDKQGWLTYISKQKKLMGVHVTHQSCLPAAKPKNKTIMDMLNDLDKVVV